MNCNNFTILLQFTALPGIYSLFRIYWGGKGVEGEKTISGLTVSAVLYFPCLLGIQRGSSPL